jgi:hypothetical protein
MKEAGAEIFREEFAGRFVAKLSPPAGQAGATDEEAADRAATVFNI